jgi:addiction module HigA family antidote
MSTMDKRFYANNTQPFFPVHPGEIIKDELEYRGVSQRKLAKEIGVSYSQFNEVLNAKRPLSSELALLLEAALGIDAQPLLSIQLDYNLQQTKSNKSFSERLANIRKVAAIL